MLAEIRAGHLASPTRCASLQFPAFALRFPDGSELRPPRPLPSPAVALATPSLGPRDRQALAEPMGGGASQRRPWVWPQRAQGAARVALGVGVGAAARAEGQARSASLQPERGAASR